MHFSKTVQYAVSGVLAVYIVFFTRPAPSMVVKAMSSPIAQLAALAAIVYVGASVSLLVALVASVALVLSIPAREYLDATQMKEDVKDVAKAAGKAAAGEASDKLAKVAGKDAAKKPAAKKEEMAAAIDSKEHFESSPAPF